MPTYQQLVRHGRKKKIHRRTGRAPALEGCPQKSAVILRVFVVKPKKPNSANRRLARVRVSNGREVTVYIPGIGGPLGEHDQVLIRGGRRPDLPGVRHEIIRGSLRSAPIGGPKVDGVTVRRNQGRSHYSVQRPGQSEG